MTLYAKIACDIARDPKMIGAGPLARLLYIQSVLYSRENLTDGYIDRLVLPIVAVDIRAPASHMARLVAVGALVTQPQGWKIPEHAWSKWNPSRDEVEELREIKREAGERGNHERWHVAGGKQDPKCRLCFPKPSQKRRSVRDDSIAECDGGAIRVGVAPVSPEPEPEPEPELNPPKAPPNGLRPVPSVHPPTPLRGAS